MKNFSYFRWSLRSALALTLSLAFIISLVLVFLSNAHTFAQRNTNFHYGPFDSTSPDSGTCGNNWANDKFERSFTINSDHLYTVIETFSKGKFTTVAGPSPNACVIQASPNGNGNTVSNGITGEFSGSFDIAVTGGTFNPDARCTEATCNTTAKFIATIYGPGATYVTGATFFEFNYYTSENGSWHNASSNRGGNNGDITGAVDSNAHRHAAISVQR